MKTIGLVGGTSWASTVEYYKILNEEVNNRLGGHNFAKCLLYSMNMAEILALIAENNWDGIAEMIIGISQNLTKSGVDCILLCANTLHKVADKVEDNIDVPLIHIADETAKEIRKAGMNKVGLLGTKFTMEMDFYKEKLNEFNIEVIIPDESDRQYLQDAIFDELSKGILKDNTRNKFLEIIDDLVNKGAEGIILGCTEFPLLISPKDTSAHLFDTTQIHARAAVDFALGT